MNAPETVTVHFPATGEVREIVVQHWVAGAVHTVLGGQKVQLDPTPDWRRILPGHRVEGVVGGDFVAMPY